MKNLLIGLAMLFGAEGAARACACDWPTFSAHSVQEAEAIANEAVALVEVDVLSGYDASTGRGELLKVRQTLAGQVPPEFRIERYGHPTGGLTCDTEFQAGTRGLALIFPARQESARRRGEFTAHSRCMLHWLLDDDFRQALINAMRRRATAAASAGSRAGAPCANNA